MDTLLVLFVWSHFVQMVTSIINLEECRSPLGMNDGSITDDQIVASSVYQDDNIAFGAQNSRLDQNSGDGAWCPHSVHSESIAPSEFLQITFRVSSVLTAFIVQGRHNNGYGTEFVRRLRFEYSRDAKNWIRYKDVNGREVFDGNIDAHSRSTVHIGPPIIAKAVRILPVVQYTQRVCLRVELYGCLWEDHLVSYSAPVGDLRGVNAFEDDSYDGIIFEDMLSDGLGQLTDGTLGSSNFRFSPSNLPQGYEWVGWKNLSHPNPTFEFTFDSLRNFSSVSLHTSNYYFKHVELFYSVEVIFSKEPGHYSPLVIQKSVQQDSLHPEARWITVDLKQRVAKYVKIRLRHRGRWILLSEVSFSSVPAFEIPEGSPAGPNDTTEAESAKGFIPVVLGILFGLIGIFLIFALLFLVYRQNKYGQYECSSYDDGGKNGKAPDLVTPERFPVDQKDPPKASPCGEISPTSTVEDRKQTGSVFPDNDIETGNEEPVYSVIERPHNEMDSKQQYDPSVFKFITEEEFEKYTNAGVSYQYCLVIEKDEGLRKLLHEYNDERYKGITNTVWYENVIHNGLNLEKLRQLNDSNLKKIDDIISTRCVENNYLNYNPTSELRVAVLGKTGDGKSATAKTVLGRHDFTDSVAAHSVKKEEEKAVRIWEEKLVRLVHTSVPQDAHRPNEEILGEIDHVLHIMPDGIHAFLYVVNAERQEDEQVIDDLKELSRVSLMKYTILVMTLTDEMADFNLRSYIKEKKSLPYGKLLKELDWKVLAVNNNTEIEYEKEQNRKLILSHVAKMVNENIPPQYTKGLFSEEKVIHMNRHNREALLSKEEGLTTVTVHIDENENSKLLQETEA